MLLLNLKDKFKTFYDNEYQGDSTFELKLLNQPRIAVPDVQSQSG